MLDFFKNWSKATQIIWNIIYLIIGSSYHKSVFGFSFTIFGNTTFASTPPA